MKLYHLKAIGTVGYDCYDSFVIRAKDESEARKIANEHGGNEVGNNPTTWHGLHLSHPRPDFWLNSETSICEVLTTSGDSGIIIGSYNPG